MDCPFKISFGYQNDRQRVIKCIFIGENAFELAHTRVGAQIEKRKRCYANLLKNVILLRKDAKFQ